LIAPGGDLHRLLTIQTAFRDQWGRRKYDGASTDDEGAFRATPSIEVLLILLMTLSPTTYSYRRRSRIPPFTEGCFPSPGLARNDRIKVVFTGTIRYSSTTVLEQHLSDINRSGEVFTLDQPRFLSVRNLQVVRGQLFSGFLKLTGVRQGTGTAARAELSLDLNPTRFLAHQAEDADFSDLPIPFATPVTRSPSLGRRLAAQTLDSNDNVLVGNDPLVAASDWPAVLATYFEAVRCAVEGDVNLNDGTNNFVQLEMDWSRPVIRQAEIYWEFGVPDATGFVRSLDPVMRQIAHEARTVHYAEPADPPIERRDLHGVSCAVNALAVYCALATSIDCVVYAKTYDRVRFEVRYAANVRELVRPRLGGQAGLVELLQHTARDAHRRVSRLFQTMHEFRVSPEPELVNLVLFMAHVGTVCVGDADLARRVISLLLNTRGITVSPDGDSAIPSEVVEQLVAAGLLIRSRTGLREASRRFALIPKYAAVVEALARALTPQDATRSATA
jgi:hypothetical protein